MNIYSFNGLSIYLFISIMLANAYKSIAQDQSTNPRLIVVAVIDQMRADFLEEQRIGDNGVMEDGFAELYKHGLKELLDEGIVFKNAQYIHASTETGPGHATISTGLPPSAHGIISNDWFDTEQNQIINAVQDNWVKGVPYDSRYSKKSPINLTVPTIGDYLKLHSPKSKVISLAIKDRASILMGGQKSDYSIWFDRLTGKFVTSSYFINQLPSYFKKINGNGLNPAMSSSYINKTWDRINGNGISKQTYLDYSRNDEYMFESTGYPHTFKEKSFPHSLKYPYKASWSKDTYSLLSKSPFADELINDVAMEIIRNEKLGEDEHTDILWLGFSSPDLIGHLFGPWSQEILDEYLKLDIVIGKLIDFLDNEIGRDRYLLILTSDHGVPPIPEFSNRILQQNSKRLSKGKFEKSVREQLSIKYPLISMALRPSGSEIFGFSFDNTSLIQNKISKEEAEKAISEIILNYPGVEQTYSRVDLLKGRVIDKYTSYYTNNYFEGRSPDIFVRFKENYMLNSWPEGIGHGSVYQYDRHVPLLFFGHGLKPKEVKSFVTPMDIAHTISSILKLPQIPKTKASNSLISLIKN